MKNYPRRATGAFGGLLSLLLLMFNPLAQAQDQTTKSDDASSDPSGAMSTNGGSSSGLLSEITYGGKIGLTSSGFYEDFFEGQAHTGSLPGLAVGGFVSYSVLDFLDVSAELLYMQQGGTRVELKESCKPHPGGHYGQRTAAQCGVSGAVARHAAQSGLRL